jgi:predicted RNA-binding Zn-ribbon protein involved in translation (DUF1610 family)
MGEVLFIDIETSPNLVYTWGLWNQNVTIEKIKEPGRILCFAAQWEGETDQDFRWAQDKYTPEYTHMLELARDYLDAADIVVHFNGRTFDIPWLMAEIVSCGLKPPSPFKQIDLCQVAQKVFRFPSNKLDYIAPLLLGQGKVKHPGFQLWLDVMDGDREAWKLMEKYNKQDVALLTKLYPKLQAWIPYHPARRPFEMACPACGSDNLVKRGLYMAKTREYQRYVCRDCGKWSRGIKSTDQRGQVVSL